jgi:hypothetical protein
MKLNLLTSTFTLISIVALVLVPTAAAKRANTGYQTGFVRWRAADGNFSSWTFSDVILDGNGALALDWSNADAGSSPYLPGDYNGGNYYNDGTPFRVGEAISREIQTSFDYQEAIASWNAFTPEGSWVEIQFRANYGTHWSKWFILGIWASDSSTIQRHSVRSQGDSDGFVAVDTFISSNKKEATNAFQLKFLLFSENGTAIPTVRNASVAYSTTAPKSANASNGNPLLWGKPPLSLPECSQMVYPDGGEVWCSPTSTSMVLGHWNNDTATVSCETRVRAAVDGVFDWIYDGHGNWPFNTAYAATQGFEGYVARFTSLAKVEEFIDAGVPVVMSIAWDKGDLTNSYIDSTNGHLLVLVGFNAAGDLIVNDPASPSDGAAVQHIYLRAEFEPLWLEASGGTVYLIYPEGHDVPAMP